MSSNDIFKEKSPLSNRDCFVVFERRKDSFTFPVHVHPEYELNYVEGANGARRIVGDSLELIGDKDLVLIANPKLKHAWKDGEKGHSDIHEITIQFHASLLENYLDKKQFSTIQKLFQKASRGVVFGEKTVEKVLPLIRILTLELERDGFYSVMKLLIIFYELSKAEDIRLLASSDQFSLSRDEVLLAKMDNFISENVNNGLSLPLVAEELNMSTSTFSRFLKSTTNLSYTEYLLDFKVNMAIRKLKGNEPIADIVEQCGFNSTSYFYRVFKKFKNMTPVEFRTAYQKQQIIV